MAATIPPPRARSSSECELVQPRDRRDTRGRAHVRPVLPDRARRRDLRAALAADHRAQPPAWLPHLRRARRRRAGALAGAAVAAAAPARGARDRPPDPEPRRARLALRADTGVRGPAAGMRR